MNIALIAHDSKKELMVQFCIAYCRVLSQHDLCATGTTGKLVAEATGLRIQRFLSGTHGGDQQIAARIACNEIDLRGMMTDEAELAVERFLDNAVMGKLNEVTIIHGKGTGALRKAVQQQLRRHPRVKSFRLGRYGEGEDGVTVVELKQ